MGQIIFIGKNAPSCEPPPNRSVIASDSHQTTERILVDCLALLELTVNPEGCLVLPWIALLDCAPAQVGQPFRDSLRARLGHGTLCFIPPTFTATCQPSDIHYMSRLKTEWMAAAVLRSSPAERTEGRMHMDLRMSEIRQPLLEWCSSTLTERGDFSGCQGARLARHRSACRPVAGGHQQRTCASRCRNSLPHEGHRCDGGSG